MNWQRVYALFLRYAYLYPRSVPRILDLFFWPITDVLIWGFLTLYLASIRGAVPNIVTLLLGALVFWNFIHRSQQAVSIAFLEEVWERNLLNIFSFGLTLIPFVLNLFFFGWTLGLVATVIILRFGQSAQVLAFALTVLLQPFASVFYPVSVLPSFLQPIAFLLPATHVFEGMRAVVLGGSFSMEQMLIATLLNIAWATISLFTFFRMFDYVREKGRLARLID